MLLDLYVMKDANGRFKVGVTKQLSKRRKTLETALGMPIVLVRSWSIPYQGRKLEQDVFKEFSEFRLDGEWFSCVNVDIVEEMVGSHIQNTAPVKSRVLHIFENRVYSRAKDLYHPVTSTTHFVSLRTGEHVKVSLADMAVLATLTSKFRQHHKSGKDGLYSITFSQLARLVNCAKSVVARSVRMFEEHGIISRKVGLGSEMSSEYLSIQQVTLLVKD